MILDELLTEAKIITTEPKSGLWFRHESPYSLTTLKPQTYATLKKVRPGYDINVRKNHEKQYRKILGGSTGSSFLYATVVGCNKMETPSEYPGYTYYFHLSDAQIERCLFDVVDKKKWMEPTKGKEGLKKAQKIWKEHGSSFTRFTEAGFGKVDPRIEVIIPFSVTPEQYIEQEENR